MLLGLMLLFLAFDTVASPEAGKDFTVALASVVWLGAGVLALATGYALVSRRAWIAWTRVATGVCSLLLAALFLITPNALVFTMGILSLILAVGLLYYLRPKRKGAGSP